MQHLRLECRNHKVKISSACVTSKQPSSRTLTNFSISHLNGTEKIHVVPVEAMTLSKITSNLPLRPVLLDTRWKHLDSLKLANPGFGTAGNVDLLLGADIFSHVVVHGERLAFRVHRLH